MMDLSRIVIVERNPGMTVVRVITYPALLIAGLVLLDENGRYDISAEISEQTVLKADLTAVEKMALEDNNEEINVIFDEVSLEVENFNGSKQEKIQLANELWSEYSEVMDEDAMSGLIKVFNL